MSQSRAPLVRALRRLFVAYGQAHDIDRAGVYAELLADLAPEELERACWRLCQTGGRFLPTVAEIRSAVAEARCALPAAELAWREVLAAVGRYGRDRRPEWSSPAIAEAVEAVGWRDICLSTTIGVERAHFLRAYGAARGRAIELEQVGPVRELVGSVAFKQIGGKHGEG